MKYCREHTLSCGIGDGKTKFYIQDEIDKLTDALGIAIRNLALNDDLPNDPSTWEDKIEMLRASNQLYSMIYGDDLMYHHGRLAITGLFPLTKSRSAKRKTLLALSRKCAVMPLPATCHIKTTTAGIFRPS